MTVTRYEIVVIGTSWGGLSALSTLLEGLPRELELPIVCVQHRHHQSVDLMAALLQDHTALRVCEIEDKAPILAGSVYVAPANYHVLVERGSFVLSVDDPVRYSRPSIDLTLATAADAYGPATIGVVLTGANADGALGLRRVVDRGGLAIVQDPATAESPIMPRAAIDLVPNAAVLDVRRMGGFIANQLGKAA